MGSIVGISVQIINEKSNSLSRPSYMPKNDAELDIWLKNFYTKLVLYATQFGISAAELASVLADSIMLTYVLAQVGISKGELEKRYEYKRTLLDAEVGSTLGAFPLTATIAAAPAPVAAGMVTRIKNMVKRITGMPNYTINIGRDMGIVPVKAVKTLKSNEKPSFTVSTEAGHPLIKWKKGDVEGINIYVDRGDGKGSVLLCGCNRAKFVDMYPLPSTVTTWSYGIIYTKASQEYGVISDISTIAVIANFATGDNSTK